MSHPLRNQKSRILQYEKGYTLAEEYSIHDCMPDILQLSHPIAHIELATAVLATPMLYICMNMDIRTLPILSDLKNIRNPEGIGGTLIRKDHRLKQGLAFNEYEPYIVYILPSFQYTGTKIQVGGGLYGVCFLRFILDGSISTEHNIN